MERVVLIDNIIYPLMKPFAPTVFELHCISMRFMYNGDLL